LPPLAQRIHDDVRAVCEWRLRRAHAPPLVESEGDRPPADADLPALTLDEVIACLQRLRKSVTFWTKDSGRRGYLDYVNGFLP
jgi:hypothetical protein